MPPSSPRIRPGPEISIRARTCSSGVNSRSMLAGGSRSPRWIDSPRPGAPPHRSWDTAATGDLARGPDLLVRGELAEHADRRKPILPLDRLDAAPGVLDRLVERVELLTPHIAPVSDGDLPAHPAAA